LRLAPSEDESTVKLNENLDQALDRLQAGGLVAFATETIWGLAARADSPEAVGRLRAWKGRSADQPISILVNAPAGLAAHHFVISPLARSLMDQFWPGPVTLVLPCGRPDAFAPGIARSDGAIGVRCSPHPSAGGLVAAALGRGLGPLTATSLNRHGERAAENRSEALAMIRAEASAGDTELDRPLLLEPGDCDASLGSPSSVLDLCGAEPRLLREGDLAAALECRLASARAAS
jgi:L-threonylcarbamoyladenylate synthase